MGVLLPILVLLYYRGISADGDGEFHFMFIITTGPGLGLSIFVFLQCSWKLARL